MPGELGFAQSLRMSEEMPDSPLKPDSFSSIVWIFSKDFESNFLPSLLLKWNMIAGSIEPDLVPIIGPSSGVKPMDVSRHLFPRIAARLIPLPMWQVMMAAFGFLRSLRACAETYL